jgi:hypothetical protein
MQVQMSLSPKHKTIVRRKRSHNTAVHAGHDFKPEKPLAEEVLEVFARIFSQKAFSYLRDDDEPNFRYCADRAVQAAKELAPYQQPKFASVARGADRDIRVTVTGGFLKPNNDGSEE